MHAALEDDGNLLSADERNAIDQVANKLIELSKGSDERAIKEGIAELDKAATEFVARRMDGNIKKALAGHNVDEF